MHREGRGSRLGNFFTVRKERVYWGHDAAVEEQERELGVRGQEAIWWRVIPLSGKSLRRSKGSFFHFRPCLGGLPQSSGYTRAFGLRLAHSSQ